MHSESSSRQYLTEGPDLPRAPADQFGDQPVLRTAPRAADARLRSRYAGHQLPDHQETGVGGGWLSAQLSPWSAARPILENGHAPANPLLLAATRWIVAYAFALIAAGAIAQPRYGLAPEVSAVFERWVHGDLRRRRGARTGGDNCGAMRRSSSRLSERRSSTGRRRPNCARCARRPRSASRRGRNFPSRNTRVEGVSEKDLAAFRRVSRQAYVDDQVRRFATGYRANAVAGLGIIGGPGARETLARLASQQERSAGRSPRVRPSRWRISAE